MISKGKKKTKIVDKKMKYENILDDDRKTGRKKFPNNVSSIYQNIL